MLPWCIGLAAAMHVLLLTAAAPAGPRLGGPARHAAGHAARTLSVRLIAEESAPQGEAAVAASAAAPASEASGVQAPPSVAADAASEASAAASESAPGASASASSPAPDGEADSSAVPASSPGDASGGGYVPRPYLSIAPVATEPVVIPAAPGSVDVGRRVGVLALYIDEQGRVRRVEAEPPTLPEAMERAAREAFMGAHFSPGQVDGHAVKSRIRVEVVFDDTPESAASATRASSSASAAASSSSAAAPGAKVVAPNASAAASAGAQRSP